LRTTASCETPAAWRRTTTLFVGWCWWVWVVGDWLVGWMVGLSLFGVVGVVLVPSGLVEWLAD